jgi:hypothetical protein
MGRKKLESRDQAPHPVYVEPREPEGEPAAKSVDPAVKIPMVPDIISTIHGSRGFVDVGNDASFVSKTDLMRREGGPLVVSSWKKEAAELVVKSRAPQPT